MKNENHACSGFTRKLVSASVLFAVFSQGAFAAASAPDTTATTRELQEVIASLDGIIGNVSILAANVPTMPGYYDADASGRDINSRTLAGNSPRNVVLGSPVRNNSPRAMNADSTAKLTAAPSAVAAEPLKVHEPAGAPAVPVVAAAAPADAAKAAAAVAASVAAVASPTKPLVVVASQVWTIKPNATVEETLASWAQTAGWNPPKWEAATPYRIIDGAPIEGSFMDALRALANAMPQLNFNASPKRRELVVSDARK